MTNVKSFIFDSEPFLLPVDTVKVYQSKPYPNGGVWALYHNYIEAWTLTVVRAKKDGKPGWRIRQIAGIMNVRHATNFVETHCGGCLGLWNN